MTTEIIKSFVLSIGLILFTIAPWFYFCGNGGWVAVRMWFSLVFVFIAVTTFLFSCFWFFDKYLGWW